MRIPPSCGWSKVAQLAQFIIGAVAATYLSVTLNAGVLIYWISMAVLSRIRRWQSPEIQGLEILVESTIFGFWIAWLNSEFISAGFPRNSWAIRAGAGVAFGLQAMILGLCLWGIRRLSWGKGVVLMTLGATIAESAQMRWGVAWPILSVVMAFTDTPIIQWLPVLGTFGLSTV